MTFELTSIYPVFRPAVHDLRTPEEPDLVKKVKTASEEGGGVIRGEMNETPAWIVR